MVKNWIAFKGWITVDPMTEKYYSISPYVPGGVSTAIKTVRSGNKAIDAITTGNKVDNAVSSRIIEEVIIIKKSF